MREIEELLRQDRNAPLPEPPDVRYTVAALKRRVAPPPAPVPALPERADWLLIAACISVVAGGGAAAVALGLKPWWLLAVPVSAFPLFPILLRKGV